MPRNSSGGGWEERLRKVRATVGQQKTEETRYEENKRKERKEKGENGNIDGIGRGVKNVLYSRQQEVGR